MEQTKLNKLIYLSYKLYGLCLFLIMITVPAFAVPAPPNFVTVEQPDGNKVEVKVMGDEKINWLESKDGYTLLWNDEGYIVYAMQSSNGDMIASTEVYASNNNLENTFLSSIPKKLRYSESQVETLLQVWDVKQNIFNNDKPINNLQSSDMAVIGTRKYLVVLMSYQDKIFTKTREEYDDLFNKKNYKNIGSVRDFYLKNSYGKFTPEFTVIGPFMASEDLAYYKTQARKLAIEAAEWASNSDINFAEYDNTKDGFVDAITVIFAGYGREAGNQEAIWSHASYVYDNQSSPPHYNGKYIGRYCCLPELRGNNGNNISAIGVAAHEFCHTLGAPDYYDVNYSTDGAFTGAGLWCLMSSGSWNGGGDVPANINIYQKYLYDWVTPEVLGTDDKMVTNMPNSAETQASYILNTDTKDEFFILENRQKIDFDRYVPGTGLLIWHVHSNIWDGTSGINSKHPQRMYPVCASSKYTIPENTPSSYGAIDSDGCPYPGSSNNRNFTDYSTPAALSWAKQNTYRPITNITENNKLISFNYAGRPNVVFSIPYQYDFTDTKHFGHYTVIDANNDEIRVWTREQETNGNWCAKLFSIKYSTDEPADDWLILPPMFMESGFIYKISFFAKAKDPNFPESLKLFVGTGNTVAGQTVQILDLPEITNSEYQKFTADFIVPNAGIYYIGFHCYSGAKKWELSVDNIGVTATVGINDDITNHIINIYPNPANEKLIVENLDNVDIQKIEITDLIGNTLLSIPHNSLENIDLTTLGAGGYWIKIHTLKGIVLKKIIKK